MYLDVQMGMMAVVVTSGLAVVQTGRVAVP